MTEQATYNREKVLALIEEFNLLVEVAETAHSYIHGGQDRGPESQERYDRWRKAYRAWWDRRCERVKVESASGAVSDTDVSSPLADRTTDRIVAEAGDP